jgi:hypothetical protein
VAKEPRGPAVEALLRLAIADDRTRGMILYSSSYIQSIRKYPAYSCEASVQDDVLFG